MALLLLAGLAAVTNALTATVNTGQTFQTMDGFGFSQAFGRANDLINLNADQRQYALDLLFSPTKGAGMTILRNRIGSGSGDSILPTSPGSPNATPQYKDLGTDSNPGVGDATGRQIRGKDHLCRCVECPGVHEDQQRPGERRLSMWCHGSELRER
jgi:O-glycosyl hydrolase